MPLEATMIVIDNSEYMRNGDYIPTRFEAQKDAVTSVFQAKVDSNPENLVGVMTMAGKGPEVLATNTKDIGHILQALHSASSKVGGIADITTAISVAQLALKHRQNKNLRQRIIVFVGSPLTGDSADEGAMVKLAKRLKKNSVSVDVVAFGEGVEEEQTKVLRAFIENINASDNSHLVVVPPGPQLLSDHVNSSPILAGDRGIPDEVLAESTAAAGASGAAGGFEFGVDPSLDPELALALRMSMEEEQARQAAAVRATSGESSSTATATASAEAAPQASATPAPAATTTAESRPAVATEPADATDDEEEAMLQQAIALSEGQDVEMDVEPHDGDEDEDMSEEEAIARAIEMSMKEQGKRGNENEKK